MRISANLGLLWPELALPARVAAAAAAGFDAVEMHWPQDDDEGAVAAAVTEAGLPVVSVNTARGGPGLSGLSALPGREAEARAEIDRALACARRLGARAVHVMAGRAEGAAAWAAFRGALSHACDRAEGLEILIEPLNPADAPGYLLGSVPQALEVIAGVGRPELRLMFDVYHVARIHGPARVAPLFEEARGLVGHVQFAGIPDRAEPGPEVLETLRALRWDREAGAEYRPAGRTEDGLGWLAAARAL